LEYSSFGVVVKGGLTANVLGLIIGESRVMDKRKVGSMSAITLPTTVYDLLVLKGLLQAGYNHAQRQGDGPNMIAYAAWINRVNAALEGKV
jgi:hypothetical protein